VKGFKQKLLVVLRWSVYPLFYLLCLVAFFYATFPWDRGKDRIIAEFEATQAAKGSEAQRLELAMSKVERKSTIGHRLRIHRVIRILGGQQTIEGHYPDQVRIE